MGVVEPEREMVRRTWPLGPPAILIALLLATAIAGPDAGWSAAIGVTVVYLNFVVNGLSLARAAGMSLTALHAVALIGLPVRLGAIVALVAILNRFDFFSPLAFLLAVVPATIVLLGYEMKLLAGGLGQELRLTQAERGAPS